MYELAVFSRVVESGVCIHFNVTYVYLLTLLPRNCDEAHSKFNIFHRIHFIIF